MKKLSAQFILKLAIITLAAFIVFNFTLLKDALGTVFDVLQPVFIGIVIALILNVPMEFCEKKLFKKLKKRKLKRALSLSISIVLFAGVLALIFGLAVPSAVKSIKNLIDTMGQDSAWDKLAESGAFMNFLVTQGKVIYENFVTKLNDYVPKMLEIAQNVFKVIANILLGLGVAIMILSNKHGLKVQVRKFLNGICKKKEKIARFTEVTDLAVNKFSRYLGGQVIEAVILGIVCYICMVILRLPYAPLISMIIGFVNLIPIVGAYIGGALGAILIFSVSPTKAVIFIVFVIILQQVESFTTYPIIVGKYVGLNGFWIMVSIIIWGGLLGFWGVFLGVPFTAFLHDYVNMLITKKEPVLALPPPTSG